MNKTLSSQNLFISGPGARKSQEGTETTAGAGTLTPQSTSAPGSKQTRQNIVGKQAGFCYRLRSFHGGQNRSRLVKIGENW